MPVLFSVHSFKSNPLFEPTTASLTYRFMWQGAVVLLRSIFAKSGFIVFDLNSECHTQWTLHFWTAKMILGCITSSRITVLVTFNVHLSWDTPDIVDLLPQIPVAWPCLFYMLLSHRPVTGMQQMEVGKKQNFVLPYIFSVSEFRASKLKYWNWLIRMKTIQLAFQEGDH